MLRLAILTLMLLAIGCTTLTTADIEDTVDTAVAAALAEQKAVSSPGEATASGAALLPGAIASRAFIKIGDIEGESTDTGHEGEIDVLVWSWGVTLATAGMVSTGEATTDPAGTREEETTSTESAEVQRQEFKLTKHIDKASPKLYQALASGTITPETQLTVRNEAEGQARTEYLVIVMTNVMVTSVNAGGGGDRPTENVTLNYSEIKRTYIEQDSSGAPVGDPTGFDLELQRTSHDTLKAIINNMR